MVRLRTLDVRENFDKNGIQIYGQNTNESLSTYTTTSWNLCHRVASGSIYLQGELTFLQDLNSQTEESIMRNNCIKCEQFLSHKSQDFKIDLPTIHT